MVYNRASPPLSFPCTVYKDNCPQPDPTVDELRYWPLTEMTKVEGLMPDNNSAQELAKKITTASPNDRQPHVAELEAVLKKLIKQKLIYYPADISSK